MEPPSRYDAKQEYEDEAPKGIAVDADELTNRYSTSGSFSESHFKNLKIR